MKKNRIFYITLITAAVVAASGCSLKPISFGNDKLPTTVPGSPTEGITEAPSTTPVPTAPQATSPATPTAEPTKAVDATPTTAPTATPTVTPEPTKAPVQEDLSGAQAKEKLASIVGSAYTVSDAEKITVNGEAYYIFSISDANRIYTPGVIVSAKSGSIFYYYSDDEITEFASFPPDNSEAGGQEGTAFSAEDAIKLLEKVEPDQLALPAPITEYKLSVDEWTSMIRGEECYCINAYAALENRNQLMGIYYVTVDGSSVYRDDMGEFILIY